jgi:hypothetical protein
VAVTIKNAMSGMLRHVSLERTGILEECSTSIIRCNMCRLLVTLIIPTQPILVTLMMGVILSSETSVLTEPQCVTSQKTALFTHGKFYCGSIF